MAHTPGPWRAEVSTGNIILNGSAIYSVRDIPSDRYNQCDIVLMAAAPEMLSALWYAYDYLNDRSEECPQDGMEWDRLTEAKRLVASAVSKALGREVV